MNVCRSAEDKPRRRINLVDKDGKENLSISINDYEEFIRYKDAVGYGLNMIKMVGKPVHGGPRVELVTNGQIISYLVDTGAAVNVMDQITLESMEPRPILTECPHSYYGYSSDKPIKMIGQFDAELERGRKKLVTRFVVAAVEQVCLISYDTARELGLVSIHLVKERVDELTCLS